LTLVAALLPPLVIGCGGTEAAEEPRPGPVTRTPELVMFVFDRSTSIPDHTLSLARDLMERRIGQLEHGDRIAAMQLLQLSLAEPPQRWSQQIPHREVEEAEIARDSTMRARFLKDARAYLAAFSDTTGRDEINGTDILSTMHDVAAEIRPYSAHRRIMYLFSDMLQSNRTIEMEGLRAMPPSEWAENEAAEGKLPDLSGLCVFVVGARVDTDASQRVKQFWEEYFAITGAELLDQNYTLRPVELPARPCGRAP